MSSNGASGVGYLFSFNTKYSMMELQVLAYQTPWSLCGNTLVIKLFTNRDSNSTVYHSGYARFGFAQNPFSEYTVVTYISIYTSAPGPRLRQ